MYCKVCNTRLGQGDRHCPNCGTDAPAEAAFAKTSPPSPLPAADLSRARDPEEDDEVLVELEEVSGEQPPPEKPAPPKPAPPAAKPSKPTKAPSPPPRSKPAPAPSPSAGAPLFAPDPAGLRALLTEQPDALEGGLSVFRNESGKAVGSSYVSGVGDIDLLATDAAGDLVVVMISERGQGEELIAEVLQRVGWVRKHVGEGRKKVRGVVLCEEAPEGLSYAAAAVADTITFKTYRVALTFDDLEI